MKETNDIILNISHRPWILPDGQWSYYQEWNNALFLHWKVSMVELLKLVPKSIAIDTFAGEAWISLVAFSMRKIRPRGLPAISAISDFHEINIRTYVTKDNKPGVYFLNIEAEKQLSTWIAKTISGLPYEKANMIRGQNSDRQTYTSKNKTKGFCLDASFGVGETTDNRTGLDKWLIERYCLYYGTDTEVYRYQVHHSEWKLKKVELMDLKANYKIGDISLSSEPDLVHYSAGVKVLAWERENLDTTIR